MFHHARDMHRTRDMWATARTPIQLQIQLLTDKNKKKHTKRRGKQVKGTKNAPGGPNRDLPVEDDLGSKLVQATKTRKKTQGKHTKNMEREKKILPLLPNMKNRRFFFKRKTHEIKQNEKKNKSCGERRKNRAQRGTSQDAIPRLFLCFPGASIGFSGLFSRPQPEKEGNAKKETNRDNFHRQRPTPTPRKAPPHQEWRTLKTRRTCQPPVSCDLKI